jgi:uncharacterized alkaline shock family protein YloU
MSESKDYIKKEQDAGSIQISEDVIAAITAAAVKEVEGVYGLNGNFSNDIASILGKKDPGKGVKLVLTEDSVAVECNIIVRFNYPILTVAKSVQECVANAIEAVTGIKVDLVNVNVCGIALSQPKEK